MRYQDHAKHFLFEAAVDAAAGIELRDGRAYKEGKSFTPAELRKFRRAVVLRLRAMLADLEADGVLAAGDVLPSKLEEYANS